MQFNRRITQFLFLDRLWRQRFVTQMSSKSLGTGKIRERGERKVSFWEPWLCEIIFWNQACKWFLKIISPPQPSLQNWLSHSLPSLPLPSRAVTKEPHPLLSCFPLILCSATPAPAGKGGGDQSMWGLKDFYDCRSYEVGMGFLTLKEI